MPRIDISAFGERPGSVTVPGPDPARDARVDAYRDRERRRAARLLDRYLEVAYEVSGHNLPLDGSLRLNAAGDRFVEAVGDYVLSRLQQKSHYGVRGSQTIGEHEATRDDPECRYPNGVCTCSGSPHSAAEARVCACPPSICYSGEARALDLPCRANAEPTEHPMRPCDCDECRVKLAAIDELSKIMQSDDYLRPEPRNADSACEGEVAGICSGGPAHHPHCPSARYGLPDEGPA